MSRPATKVAKVTVLGPLAPYAAVYKERLGSLGYTPLSIVNELRQLAHLSSWMDDEGIGPAQLGDEQLTRFLALRARGGRGPCSASGLVPLLEILREGGVLAADDTSTSPTAADELLSSFHGHLLAERGLANCTAEAYVARSRRFLHDLGPHTALEALTAAEVTRAVEREAARVSVGSTQYYVAALRAFLRFCFLEDKTANDLSAAALAVTGRRRSSLPKGISAAHTEALLNSCDRRRRDGRRDHAILLLLVRLGLRAGEVASLRLDDIDWHAGELVVHGKGRRQDRMPLPSEVGEAIVAYLQRGRPRCSHREVFVRLLAPIGPLGRGGVACVVRRACKRAGVPVIGPHRLRHSLACEMVSAGVGLAEIGQVLRHSGLSSVLAYARLDLDALRELALPWPGSEPS